MTKIIFDKNKHDYNPIIKTFFVSERDVPFDTTYELVNPKTKQSMVFDFSHSTGSEWDADTRWVYKTKDGELTLWVGNDAEVTKARADAYLKGKLRKKTGGVVDVQNQMANREHRKYAKKRDVVNEMETRRKKKTAKEIAEDKAWFEKESKFWAEQNKQFTYTIGGL